MSQYDPDAGIDKEGVQQKTKKAIDNTPHVVTALVTIAAILVLTTTFFLLGELIAFVLSTTVFVLGIHYKRALSPYILKWTPSYRHQIRLIRKREKKIEHIKSSLNELEEKEQLFSTLYPAFKAYDSSFDDAIFMSMKTLKEAQGTPVTKHYEDYLFFLALAQEFIKTVDEQGLVLESCKGV